MAASTNHDEKTDIDKWKRVIAELCTEAPDYIIRDCLRSYDPSKTTKQIKKTLNTFDKATIGKTLDYLSKRNHNTKVKKDVLLDALIMKVKNHFPDICQICKKEYCHKLDDEPFLECHSCGQEVHKSCYFNLLVSMNLLDETGMPRDILFKIPGIHYLCVSCEDEHGLEQGLRSPQQN